MSKQERVLVIDALNMYFRAYIVNPALSLNGQPIGGIVGFFKILQKLARETSPDKIVICWDGPNGSQKRRKVVKEYKAGRKPIRLNRAIRNLSEDEEMKNKIWQQTRLFEYLNHTPVIQTMLPSIEADDVISYVVRSCPEFKGWQKVIVSSDKDFFQLCDDNTVLLRPIQKEVLNKKAIIEKHNIHPENFALARAIAGDKSDNLPGVPGVGLATVSKRFPFFANEDTVTIEQLEEYCANIDSSLKVYESITENIDTVKLNYKMMQLYSPTMSAQSKMKVSSSIRDCYHDFNKTQIMKMMHQDGFGATNWTTLFQVFNHISHTYGADDE